MGRLQGAVKIAAVTLSIPVLAPFAAFLVWLEQAMLASYLYEREERRRVRTGHL